MNRKKINKRDNKSKIKLILQNMALFIITLVICFLFLELFLRMTEKKGETDTGTSIYQKSENPKLFYTPKANIHRIRTNQIIYDTNDEGFRDDKNYTIEELKNKTVILFIGDSVTAQINLNLTDTYPKIFEKELKKNNPNIVILNLGVNGYATEQEIEILKEKGLKYKPKYIILGYVHNDPVISSSPLYAFIQTKEERRECMIISLNLRIPCKLKNIFHNFKSIEFLYSKFIYLKYMLIKDFWRQINDDPALYNNVITGFDQLLKITKENNITTYVAIFPIIKYESNKYKWQYLQDKVKKDAIEKGFKVIDIYEEYKKYNDYTLRDSYNDYEHPNKIGSEIAGKYIAQKFIEVEQIELNNSIII